MWLIFHDERPIRTCTTLYYGHDRKGVHISWSCHANGWPPSNVISLAGCRVIGALRLNIAGFQTFHFLQMVPTPDYGRIVG